MAKATGNFCLRRSLLWIGVCGGLAALANDRIACADGGTVRVIEEQGEYRLTVFTSPTPLRAGPIDISLFLEQTQTRKPILDADVTLKLTPAESGSPAIHSHATREQATNQLLYAALIDLPHSGVWDVDLNCRIAGLEAPLQVRFSVDAGPSLGLRGNFWLWVAWPMIPIVLFIVHRVLAARQANRRSGGRSEMPETGGLAEDAPSSDKTMGS